MHKREVVAHGFRDLDIFHRGQRAAGAVVGCRLGLAEQFETDQRDCASAMGRSLSTAGLAQFAQQIDPLPAQTLRRIFVRRRTIRRHCFVSLRRKVHHEQYRDQARLTVASRSTR